MIGQSKIMNKVTAPITEGWLGLRARGIYGVIGQSKIMNQVGAWHTELGSGSRLGLELAGRVRVRVKRNGSGSGSGSGRLRVGVTGEVRDRVTGEFRAREAVRVWGMARSYTPIGEEDLMP